jgi:hypothetical protein
VVNTSSFRIDRLAAYLGADGLSSYFDLAPNDARRFADMLLSEVLPAYAPPPVEVRDWAEYLDAAFAVPENRCAADEAYVEVLRQLGDYYGFFCAVRAGSRGESFVARNVGLRRVFRDGTWRVQTIFMDHDAIVVAGRDYTYCDAEDFLERTFHDLTHMLGGTVRGYVPGCAGALKAIYRVGPAAAAEGMRALKTAFRARYEAGQDAIAKDVALRSLFRTEFAPHMRDWDDVVRLFLAARRENAPPAKWRRAASRLLRERGHGAKSRASIVQLVADFALLLPWFSFLFEEPEVRRGARALIAPAPSPPAHSPAPPTAPAHTPSTRRPRGA